MVPVDLVRRMHNLVLLCVLATTLVVTPWMNLDPINLPKFLIIVTCSFAALGSLAPYLKWIMSSEMRLLTFAILFFLLILTLVFFFSGAGIWTQFYGAHGRNTGLLAYVSLSLMMFSAAIYSNVNFVRKLIWALISTGAVNAFYGLIQWSGNDPVKWDNPYNPIVGTLGNPNFVSAHLGMSGLASLAFLLEKSIKPRIRTGLLVNILASLFVTWKSDSSQGLLVFALCATLIFYFKFLASSHQIIRTTFWFAIGGLSILGLMGILNKGFFASYLYQSSVTYRGDYWRAGWTMTLEHPFFGVGLDTYGDWYRFSRTETATMRRGPEIISNSAHNVFLDISSSGGFTLLLAYLLIVGLIVRSGLRVLRQPQGFDVLGVALVISWMAYIIQSVISINQLGLAIWGWVLGGAIIGYERYRDRMNVQKKSINEGDRSKQLPSSVVLTGTLGLIIGFVLSVWPVAQDISFWKSLESGDGAKIELAAKKFPRNNFYYIYASRILLDNNFKDKSLELARLAIANNPRDFNGWMILISNPKLSATEIAIAKAKMKELDPFNNMLDN